MKRNMYIYVHLDHFVVHQKLIQHCKSTIFQLKKKRLVTHIVWSILDNFSETKLITFYIHYKAAVKSEGSGTTLPGFESWLCHFLPE